MSAVCGVSCPGERGLGKVSIGTVCWTDWLSDVCISGVVVDSDVVSVVRRDVRILTRWVRLCRLLV